MKNLTWIQKQFPQCSVEVYPDTVVGSGDIGDGVCLTAEDGFYTFRVYDGKLESIPRDFIRRITAFDTIHLANHFKEIDETSHMD